MKPIKIALACSAGGHLAEISQLAPFYEKFEHFFVTFKRPDSEELAKTKKVFFVERPARNLLKTMDCIAQSFQIIKNEQPDLVLSTGADAAIPLLIWAKIFGKKVVFVESFCRINRPSLSGKIMYPLADLFIYQWEENAPFFPKGKMGGSIF